MKTIAVIPGGIWQIPIIKKIKSMGYRVITINPYKNSPAFEFADEYLQSDIFDEEKVLGYLQKNNVDALISDECDIAMPVVAKYGSELGLEVLSLEVANLYTDKYAMREFCKKNDIPYPQYMLCHNMDEAVNFYKNIGGKMIMKPLDSNSSRGVFTVDSIEKIKIHFDETIGFSRVQKAIILEQYIDGIEFTIDGIKTPERHYNLAISEKKHFKHNMNIASDLYFTHENANFDYELLRKTNDKFVNASGLIFGLTHAEYKYCNGNFYLIEIAARGGGNKISSDIVPFMSGIDNYDYLINCSLGDVENIKFSISDNHLKKAAVLKFFKTPNVGGKVAGILGLEYLKEAPYIVDYRFNFGVGDIIEPAKNDAARVGYYIACCDTEESLKNVMVEVDKNVKILLEE